MSENEQRNALPQSADTGALEGRLFLVKSERNPEGRVTRTVFFSSKLGNAGQKGSRPPESKD